MFGEPNVKATTAIGADNKITCIVCGYSEVEEFLDLGVSALANKFLRGDDLSQPEPKFPLKVGFCHRCNHVQLVDKVPPPDMFDDYLYMSSASDTLKAHLYDLSDIVVRRQGLGADDLVIDIGCNDGTLLNGFKRHGVRTLGVDPAKNLAELTKDNVGTDRFADFFNEKNAATIVERWGPAKVITATNTFPHIPELQDFVAGLKIALAEGGVFVIEMHYLVDMIEQLAFDTVYHEHVSYWALGPMQYLFESNGLEIVDVTRVPLHHGQLRVFVQRQGEGKVQPSVQEILDLEKSMRLDEFATFEAFARDIQVIKKDLLATIDDLRAQGKRVVGYGAPAKGNTLLSFLEIRSDRVEYIADKSPLKQGLYTPGMHIPVVPPERLLLEQPDYVILFAWNFRDEILQQQQEYRERGGKFIVPIPKVEIV